MTVVLDTDLDDEVVGGAEEDARAHGRVMPFPAKHVLGLSPSVSLNDVVDVTVADDGTVSAVHPPAAPTPPDDTLIPVRIVQTQLPVEVWDWYYELIMGGKSPSDINPERWHLQYVYDEAQVSVPPRRSTAGRGRHGVYEAPREVETAPLPFALVRTADGDIIPVLLGDDGADSLVGVSILGDVVSLIDSDIIGAVNIEPAAVWYGVHVEMESEQLQMAAEDGEEATGPRVKRPIERKKGEINIEYPGIRGRKGMPFAVRARGQRFQWTPTKPQGLTAFPEVKSVLMRQRETIPSLESIRMAAIFAGLTVHAGTEEAEETFQLLVDKYKAMHGAMPPIEEIQDILRRHLPGGRGRMYESVGPWSVIVQDALKRGLRDRELRRFLWIEVVEEQIESVGLAKMSFALMLMGQDLICADTWLLGAAFSRGNPFDTKDPQAAAIRRRATAEHISGQWKWGPAKSSRELGLKRYEQVEDALLKNNPWYKPNTPLARTQAMWMAWEWSLGVPTYHRPWLRITQELLEQESFPRPELPF